MRNGIEQVFKIVKRIASLELTCCYANGTSVMLLVVRAWSVQLIHMYIATYTILLLQQLLLLFAVVAVAWYQVGDAVHFTCNLS